MLLHDFIYIVWTLTSLMWECMYSLQITYVPEYLTWTWIIHMRRWKKQKVYFILWLAWITRHLNKSELFYNPFMVIPFLNACRQKKTCHGRVWKKKYTTPLLLQKSFDNGSMNICFQKRISRKRRRSDINGKRKRSIRPNKFTAIRFVLSWHFLRESEANRKTMNACEKIELFFFSAGDLRIIKFFSQKIKI